MYLSSEQIAEYRNFLQKAADDNSNTTISNSGMDHAVVLYSVMLEHANKIVRIFCQSGDSYVWNHPTFIDSLHNFLNKPESHLEIMTVEQPHVSSVWNSRENVTIVHIDENAKNEIYRVLKNRSCNFAIFDDNKYRFEYDYEQFKAFGSFNDADSAKKLIELFDNAFEASKQVQTQGSNAGDIDSTQYQLNESTDDMEYTTTNMSSTIGR